MSALCNCRNRRGGSSGRERSAPPGRMLLCAIAPGSASHSNFIKILNKSGLKSISLLNEHVLYIYLAIYGRRLRKIQYSENGLVDHDKSFVNRKLTAKYKWRPVSK